MRGDHWTEETRPTRRVDPDHGEDGDTVRSGRATFPAFAWFLGLVVVLLALAVCGLWALYLLRGQIASAGPTPPPVIWTPTTAPSPTPPPTETAELIPTTSPNVAIGRYVQVAGTGGYGLNLRSGPSENYARMDVALEGEVFIITDGPTVSGGSQWWRLRDPENEEREWWAIADFLEPVDHP
jgi:hypothetical protein